MAKFKNWTVISQRVKERQDGLVTYSKYLLDEKHKNHSKNETRIVPLHGKMNEFVKSSICETLDFDMSNKKGGRKVESYAQSFVLSLPDTVQKPTDEQWKRISGDIIRAAHKHLKPDEPVNDFGRKCFSNLHDQDNPHMNLLIPRIYKGERLDKLDKKGMILAMKQAFNASVMKHCNINYDNFKPERPGRGKRLLEWQLEQQAAREEQEKSIQLRQEATLVAQSAAAQLLVAHKAKALSETSRIEAEKATAQAHQAKAEAVQAITLLGEMKNLFNQFKTSLQDWIRGIKTDDVLLEELSHSEAVTTAETMQKHPIYDQEIEYVMFESIEQAEAETKKPDISRHIRRSKNKM
jgi:hypothetical protein